MTASGRGLARPIPRVLWVSVGICALLLAARSYVLTPFLIPTGSMRPTIIPGDYVFVDQVSYGLRVPGTPWRFPEIESPGRGDIVVFSGEDADGSEYLIKRLVALPGDAVEARDGLLYVNGVVAETGAIWVTGDFGPIRVARGHGFMLGDNRMRSKDSRHFGSVPLDEIVGRARWIYWSAPRVAGVGSLSLWVNEWLGQVRWERVGAALR